MIEKLKTSFKYNFEFLKVLDSPLVGLKLKWYFGKIEHGTPYFLPRRWVKCNMNDALDAWGKLSNPSQDAISRCEGRESWLKNYTKGYTKAVPVKYFGWHFTSLGWKTKWNDYRFEWNPSLSIVIFGKQLFIVVLPNIKKHYDIRICIDSYWEAWLNYEYKTDKTKSKEERLVELKKIYSCTWSSGSGDNKVSTNYYDYILK